LWRWLVAEGHGQERLGGGVGGVAALREDRLHHVGGQRAAEHLQQLGGASWSLAGGAYRSLPFPFPFPAVAAAVAAAASDLLRISIAQRERRRAPPRPPAVAASAAPAPAPAPGPGGCGLLPVHSRVQQIQTMNMTLAAAVPTTDAVPLLFAGLLPGGGVEGDVAFPGVVVVVVAAPI
jgi:hypothetical protein